MKKNIILVAIATLTLGSAVYADEVEVSTVTSATVSAENIVEEEVEEDTLVYDDFDLKMYLPSEYAEDVTLISTRSMPPIINIVVNGEVESDVIGQIKFTPTEEEAHYSFEFIANEESFINERSTEILNYIQEFPELVFIENSTDESKELTSVYSDSGYAIEMPVEFKEEVSVLILESYPPQLVFNYSDGEEITNIFNLSISLGTESSDENVVKTGNGYIFSVNFNEVENPTDRFLEIQNYFKENISDLIILAQDYSFGNKAVVINGVQVTEYVQTGEGLYMIPLRAVTESLGMDLIWDSETRSAEVTNGVFSSKITIGSNDYTVNKSLQKFEQAPQIIDGSTYVPLSFIKDGLGLEYKLGNGALVIS